MKPYHLPNLEKGFVRTNLRTVEQRAALLREFLPKARSVGEICCGDCLHQWQVYTQTAGFDEFLGLDIEPKIVEANKKRGIPCLLGDALDGKILRKFLGFNVIFFGPPLSVDCDGHRLFAYRDIVPAYGDFIHLLVGDLGYLGTVICICPKTTTLGDIRLLYTQAKSRNEAFGVPLIHYSYSDVASDGSRHELRLKYVDVWLSSALEDQWETREGKPVDL